MKTSNVEREFAQKQHQALITDRNDSRNRQKVRPRFEDEWQKVFPEADQHHVHIAITSHRNGLQRALSFSLIEEKEKWLGFDWVALLWEAMLT